jgi:carbonic anhydrase/acetyltransferase-like protein (isoleucine patch superfamily)
MIEKSPINGKSPKIHSTAFIAKDAVIIGDVEIGAYTNIWFGVIIRGDACTIKIGRNVSIQENAVIHSEPGTTCIIGNDIIIGHKAIVHGPCEIGDSAMVGLSSTVLQESKLSKGAVLAGGSVLKGESEAYGLYAGVPAVLKKSYGDVRMQLGKEAALRYVDTGQKFKTKEFQQEISKEFLIDI